MISSPAQPIAPVVTKPMPAPAPTSSPVRTRIAGGPLTNAIRDGRVKSRLPYPQSGIRNPK